ncbi:MAG: gas vesicle protein GvpG [Acidobacteria bacterium]|nr:gas vesicle protein GvpG [Acidobacteriota bacterium]
MLLIDDLLLLPFSGFSFILRTLQRVAEDEYTDDRLIKEQLLELQLKLDSGEITEAEYAREEVRIIRKLREIEDRKRALAGAPAREQQGPLVFTAGKSKASVSAHLTHAADEPPGDLTRRRRPTRR